MKYSPVKICAYIFAVLLIMLGLTYLSSSKISADGKTKEGFYFNEIGLKYPTTNSFWNNTTIDSEKIKAIDSIVGNIQHTVISEEKENKEDKIVFSDVKKVHDIRDIPDITKIDTTKIERIQYPNNAHEFISQLKQHLNSPVCRIIHYGDSQIEGDRISSYIRNRLQGIYGGFGPGFIPIVQVYNQISADVTHSENWTRYAVFDPKQKRLEHKKYGVYTTLSRFTPNNVAQDSLDIESLPLTKATINISPSKRSYNRLKNFTKIGLHYGNAQSPTSIKVYNNGILIANDNLNIGVDYQRYGINLETTPSNLKIELESKISPDFYGLTLDGTQGVLIDNVAMRGSSGTVFAGLDNQNFTKMFAQLQPKILIFQYGGNTVPYLKDSTGVDNYARYVKNHINWVRNKKPDASVIFIGPSDMTTSENGQFTTYKLLPYLNETLQKTCLENNIAYWSMFDAMGGENSMEHWVDQKLASTDYTHFSPSGTKIIAEMFFLALYLDLIEKK